MNPIHWQRPKWLPRLLSMPVPEPAQQASRILAIQRNIVLPAKLMVAACRAVLPLLSRMRLDIPLRRDLLAGSFFAIPAAVFHFLHHLQRGRRDPADFAALSPRLVQWVVFTVGLVDGLLLAGLTVETGGFEQQPFLGFSGLDCDQCAEHPAGHAPDRAQSFPVRLLSGGGAGGSQPHQQRQPGSCLPTAIAELLQICHAGHRQSWMIFAPNSNIPPEPTTSRNISPASSQAATQKRLSNYNGGTNAHLQQLLADDLNRIIQNGPIYDANRFTECALSPETPSGSRRKRATTGDGASRIEPASCCARRIRRICRKTRRFMNLARARRAGDRGDRRRAKRRPNRGCCG